MFARLVLIAALALAAVPIAGQALTDPLVRVNQRAIEADGYPQTLSEYGFFRDAAARQPAEGVMPYAPTSALFSDYALKLRFAYVPPGQTATVADDGRFAFPVGSALIKSFGYADDNGEVQLIETRVLLHRADGWVALPYVWNEDGTEAVLRRAGRRLPVRFTDPSGEQREFSYAVPNQNQCASCHAGDTALAPIGPQLRNMAHDGQIERWVAAGMLSGVPAEFEAMPDYSDTSAPLDARARAYLEVNCAHCHRPSGSANNSGLFLNWGQDNLVAYGLGKRPVAAGRGSGGRDFTIDPGHADRSIMPYRMASTDPGIAMPELGRMLTHEEGVALISEWINAMDPNLVSDQAEGTSGQ